MTDESLIIEEPGLSAVDLVAALHLESFPADTGERWQAHDIYQVMHMPGIACMVARRGNEPLGYALARVIMDECELLSLGVLMSARRTGVARALVQYLKDECMTWSVRRLFLEVREDNKAALCMYEGQGFQIIGRRMNYYRSKKGLTKDAITMSYDFNK